MRLSFWICSLGAVLGLSGCADLTTSDSSLVQKEPLLDPTAFFSGRTASEGVMVNKLTGSKRRVTTETRSQWEGKTLRLEQDLAFSDGTKQHRSWRIRKTDPHHYEATANDIVGTARGESSGNAFHWSFTLALSPGNPLENVQMTQSMFLQSDDRSLINHTSVRKFGITVAQVTETFRRQAGN